VERLQHIMNWFDMHLQGKEIHIYDIPGTEPPPKSATAGDSGGPAPLDREADARKE